MLKIGDVAKQSKVSIRSLRHYDAIGLLKPSGHRSPAGYRLYTHSDVMHLQQIVSLKQMGFSLKQITTLLNKDVMTLQKTMTLQLDFLQQQIDQQQRLCRQIQHVLDILARKEMLSLELMYTTMESIKMLNEHYSEEQINDLKQRGFYQGSNHAEYEQTWHWVFNGLQTLKSAGIPAIDSKAKPFVQKAAELIEEFTGGNKDMMQTLKNMSEQQGGSQMFRNHGIEIDDALYKYYRNALQHHIRSHEQR